MRQELAALLAAIRRHPDLAARLALIGSVAGVGEKTAVAILLRMPEIGRVTREQAAALAGLAPYDQESGEHTGEKHIEGGRTRLRKALYAAALPAAFRWNAALVALYKRIIAKGTAHKAALIACARKLLVTVNAVVARGTPWTKEQAAALLTPVSWFDREPAVSSSRPGFARDGGAQPPSRMAAAPTPPPHRPKRPLLDGGEHPVTLNQARADARGPSLMVATSADVSSASRRAPCPCGRARRRARSGHGRHGRFTQRQSTSCVAIGRVERLPEVDVLHRLLVGGLPAVPLPAMDPLA